MGRQLTYFSYNSRVGLVTIAASNRGITALQFGSTPIANAHRAPCALTNEAANQVQEYFAGKRRVFEIPLDIDGSAFSQMVWKEMQEIPYGSTLTATELAKRIGRAESLRPVGNAITLAPAELLIPSHRVIGANGRVRGTGLGAKRHQNLLAFERAQLERAK